MQNFPKFTEYYMLNEGALDKLEALMHRLADVLGFTTLSDIINIYLEDKNVDLIKWLEHKNIEMSINLKHLLRTFTLVAAHIPLIWLHTSLNNLLEREAKAKLSSPVTQSLHR